MCTSGYNERGRDCVCVYVCVWVCLCVSDRERERRDWLVQEYVSVNLKLLGMIELV